MGKLLTELDDLILRNRVPERSEEFDRAVAIQR